MKKSRKPTSQPIGELLEQRGQGLSPRDRTIVERFFADHEICMSSSTTKKVAKACRDDRDRKQRCAAAPGDEGKILDRFQIDMTLCDIYLLDAPPDASQREPAVSHSVELAGPDPVTRVRRPCVWVVNDLFSRAVVGYQIAPGCQESGEQPAPD